MVEERGNRFSRNRPVLSSKVRLLLKVNGIGDPGYSRARSHSLRFAQEWVPHGMITDAVQADHIIRTGQADAVMLARQFLRQPYWPLHAAHVLGHDIKWPMQYERRARLK